MQAAGPPESESRLAFQTRCWRPATAPGHPALPTPVISFPSVAVTQPASVFALTTHRICEPSQLSHTRVGALVQPPSPPK